MLTHRLRLPRALRRFALAGLVSVQLCGCTAMLRAGQAPSERPVRVQGSSPIALVPPIFEIPVGTVVGGHAPNPERQYTLVHEWGSTLVIDPNEFNHAIRDELRTLGYTVATAGFAPHGLQPTVTRIVYNVFGSDARAGWSEAEVTVRWQVLGQVPFVLETRGSSTAQQHSLASIFQAYRIALRNFLANPQFAAAVAPTGRPPTTVQGAAPVIEPLPAAPSVGVTPVTPLPVTPVVSTPTITTPAVTTPEVSPTAAAPRQRLKRPASSTRKLDTTAAAQRARGSVVTVLVGDAWGSGIVLSEFLIATQASLVKSGTVAVVSASGKQLEARVLRTDAANDVALLEVTSGKLEPLGLDLAPATTGAAIVAIGTPFHPGLSFSVSPGRVVSGSPTHLDADARVSAGNAGGPIIDEFGRAVGMVVWSPGDAAESGTARAISAGALFRALGLGYADADPP
ncbi:MAG: trypsin-like peptidase domain-containing protein [Myxococcales bacterium]|nr:trypsin-like peptidase domain-containing protein [Myxococcales bacterium]